MMAGILDSLADAEEAYDIRWLIDDVIKFRPDRRMRRETYDPTALSGVLTHPFRPSVPIRCPVYLPENWLPKRRNHPKAVMKIAP